MRFGFCGPSYTNRSLTADAQKTMNLYPEFMEEEHSKSKMVLHGTPGLTLFSSPAVGGPIRAIWYDPIRDRVLCVAKNTVYSIDTAGVASSLGTITTTASDSPVSIAFNRTEYLIIGETNGYILNNVSLDAIADNDFVSAVQGVFLDGYFVVLKTDTQEFYISGLYNGTTWAALDFGTAEASPDDALAIFSDHGELWIFGSEKTEVFFNSGNPDFPFERIQGAVIEQGISAKNSVAKADNSIFWLGGSARGRGVVFRANGFTPERISNHAMEKAIIGYNDISDARAFTYQDEGHEFYVLNFPTGDATWVYDTTTRMWHERGWWQGAKGVFRMHRGIVHTYASGTYKKHLVGDRELGKIYQLSMDNLDDAGDAIRRIRRAPHVSNEHKFMVHRSLTIDMETGVGTQTGQGADPKGMLRFSDDGGRTWSNEIQGSLGKVGKTLTRVKFNRLGRSRDRIYEWAISDPVKVTLVDAYLDLLQGTN